MNKPLKYILSIDQGTTSTRAFIFNHDGDIVAHFDAALKQSYPQDGWVEQNPQEMWSNVITCVNEVLRTSQLTANKISAIGITNQRETTIIWDKKTGEPIYPAIVWSDRRTAEICAQLKKHTINPKITEKTGLLFDPYFSATKIIWLLENIPNARSRAEKGELLFGTLDTYLLWRLTKGVVHATDATNASRTLLFNIKTQAWDQEILQALNIPEKILPSVQDTSSHFGETHSDFFGHAIPITAMIGDQQAALVGQACFKTGMQKITYGTGCFILLNTGKDIIKSRHRLLTTIAYRLNGKSTYALEGSVFSAGTIVKWLRDKLKLINTAAESENLAASVSSTEGVYLIPAFTGLGTPYWNPNARAALLGLTSNSNKQHIVRAGLEAIAYQTKDLLNAVLQDCPTEFSSIRVDGGMTANNWLLQFIADILNHTIDRPKCIETTALGAAYMAGLHVGVYQSLDEIAQTWHADKKFKPSMNQLDSENLYKNWLVAINSINAMYSATN